MTAWAMYVALLCFGCAAGGFFKVQFSRRHIRNTLVRSGALLAFGLIAISLALAS